ncbi:hypothetical protein OIO90_001279 [Microbotryomycetes sp. JL221]|nr:hypothetical protein OIO90_001279 [Microbotryomycetes sp. JL221]
MTAPRRRGMYRAFMRQLNRTPRIYDAQKRKNLVRMFRPQLRQLIVDTSDSNLDSLQLKLNKSSSIATNTHGLLTKNLTSLSYHHYPGHVRNTNNARRTPWLPPLVKWDPQNPQAAMKAAQNNEKRLRDKHKMDVIAMTGLMEVLRLAERSNDVILGRPSGELKEPDRTKS